MFDGMTQREKHKQQRKLSAKHKNQRITQKMCHFPWHFLAKVRG